MGMVIKLKYDDDMKPGSGDDQRLNNRHTRNIVISDVFIPPKIHTVIKCVNLFRSLDYI